ncbi:formylmethanofuran dehydrogenase subunit B [Tundrisphaera sp. TA3]|uniref:formylmethanofuran dehydrogenase subunit B n=1 Tax=Tundrisphaera sp. TA3 TaxID=3435775 RepID=UPI003EB9A70A
MHETPNIVEDVTSLACGGLCDDLRVEVVAGRATPAGDACPVARDWFAAPHPGDGHPPATIDGRPVGLDEAIARAAEILGGARSPLIRGLTGTTVETMREALAIADAIGAAVDLGGSRSSDHRRSAFQRVGKVSATLGEVRDRADLVVFWHCDPIGTHARLWDRCVEASGEFIPGGRSGRTVIAIGTAPTATSARADLSLIVSPECRGDLLRILRGLVRGKALDPSRVERAVGWPFAAIRDLADRLLGARYGVFFAGGEVADAAEAEAVLTLVRDLNEGRRFVLMDPGGPGNASGVGAVATWQAGAPTALDFARGYPRYLPGEATLRARRDAIDALLVVAPAPPAIDLPGLPTILIGPGATRPDLPRTSVAIDVARPGIESGGTISRPDGVMLPLRPPLAPGPRPTDRDVLRAIGDRVRKS